MGKHFSPLNPIGPARGGERRVRMRPSATAAVDRGDGAAGRHPHRQRRR